MDADVDPDGDATLVGTFADFAADAYGSGPAVPRDAAPTKCDGAFQPHAPVPAPLIVARPSLFARFLGWIRSIF